MSVLIVGGDGIGTIKERLKENGATKISHLSGRKRGHLTKELSCNIDLVLVLTDFINHQMSKQVKRMAQEKGVKTVYARRSWAHIETAIRNI